MRLHPQVIPGVQESKDNSGRARWTGWSTGLGEGGGAGGSLSLAGIFADGSFLSPTGAVRKSGRRCARGIPGSSRHQPAPIYLGIGRNESHSAPEKNRGQPRAIQRASERGGGYLPLLSNSLSSPPGDGRRSRCCRAGRGASAGRFRRLRHRRCRRGRRPSRRRRDRRWRRR
jgi:hypothetical protein